MAAGKRFKLNDSPSPDELQISKLHYLINDSVPDEDEFLNPESYDTWLQGKFARMTLI